MPGRSVCLAVAALAFAGCSRSSWPEPPAVDNAQYQKDHDSWRDEQRQLIAQTLPILGIWTLPEGDTPFGSDAALPITLPAQHVPPNAGVIRRARGEVVVVPAGGAALRLDDGSMLKEPTSVETFLAGPVRLLVTSAPDDRRWVMAIDESHPAMTDPPMVEAFPVEARWRVAARFDAFDQPKPVRVPDVRGGTMEFMATGELVFRLAGQEMRLVAFGEPGSDELFVLFKDETNRSSTFSGYRILSPRAVPDDEWTVVDFNFAMNPPCAYSKYTVCPLPPPQNRLPIAIEAGLKRLPSARGYGE